MTPMMTAQKTMDRIDSLCERACRLADNGDTRSADLLIAQARLVASKQLPSSYVILGHLAAIQSRWHQ